MEIGIVNNIMKVKPTINGNEYKFEEESNIISPEIQNSPPFDLNCHQKEYVEFLKRISTSPKKSYLLEILQHLLQTDPDKDDRAVWKRLEDIVLHGRKESKENLSESTNNGPSKLCTEPPSIQLLPPPPPPEPQPPPPPPPPLLLASFSPPPPPPVPMSSGPVDPNIYTTPKPPVLDTLLPQQNPPAPNVKMKIICWDKIPSHEIVGTTNLWTTLASSHQKDSMKYIDWLEAESLFCLKSCSSNNAVLTLNRKSKLIKLLDSQRTFNVDILLEQFKGYKSDNDIVQLVYKGNHSAMGSEKISRLIKLLPEAEEIELLKNYDGNRDNLARAEKFLQQLIDVPSYKLRLECMSLKEDFSENVQGLQTSIGHLIQAGKDLMNNRKLHEVLYIIVLVGNFLNTGKFTGKAGGIRVASLLKLSNIRANASNMNFIHFIADQIKKCHPHLKNFPDELQNLAKVNKINIEQLIADVKKLDLRLQQVRTQIESPSTEKDIKQQMMSFLLQAEPQNANLQSGVKNVQSMHLQLSKFLCEDPSKFPLSECFNIFQNFTENFTNAVNERNDFDLKSTLKPKQKMTNNGRGKVPICAKSEFDTIPESPIAKKRLEKTNTESNNFIQKEVNHLNKDNKEVKDIRKLWKDTHDLHTSHTIQASNRSDETNLAETKEAKEISSNKFPPKTAVSERVQKYLSNIENGKSKNYQQTENTTQQSSQENPPRTSSFRLKYQEKPIIPKYEKIGKRVSSITEQDLQEIIQKLRRTTKNETSLWNIPREKLLGHIDCYHAEQDEDSLSHKDVSAKGHSDKAFTIENDTKCNNLILPDKSRSPSLLPTRSSLYSNETSGKLPVNSEVPFKSQEKSTSIFKRLTNKLRFFRKTKG